MRSFAVYDAFNDNIIDEHERIFERDHKAQKYEMHN